MNSFLNGRLDKIIERTGIGEWLLMHPCPRGIAQILSIISIILSVSAMVLATGVK